MDLVKKIPSVIAGTALAILILTTIAGVVMRYFFDSPLHWLEEMSGLLMIWIVMIGAIVTERDRQHLSIPLLVESLPRSLRIGVELVVAAASVAILLTVAWLGYNLAQQAQLKVTEILKVSWFWIDIAVPVGALGLIYYTIRNVIRDVKTLKGGHGK